MTSVPVLLRSFVVPLLSGVFFLFLYLQAAAQPTEPVWADTVLAEKMIGESRKLHLEDKHEPAFEKASQAFSIYTRLYGDNHAKSATARMFVAREHLDLYRIAEAIVLFEQSLSMFEAVQDTYWIALNHYYLSLCQRPLRRFAAARQQAQLAIDLWRPDSARQAMMLAHGKVALGSVFLDEKNYPAAIPLLEEAKAVYLFQNHKRSLGQVSYFIGGAWYGLHDFVRAKEYYLAAFAYLKNDLTPDHSYFADLYVKFGNCCQKTGESETGLRYLLEAREAYLKAGTEDDMNYVQFLQYLGQFYIDEQQYPAAAEQLERCLAAKEKRFGSHSVQLLGTLQAYGVACLKAGRYAPAETAFRRGAHIIADSLQNDRQTACSFYYRLAETVLLQGDITGSMRYCDTASSVAGFDIWHPENQFPRDHFREWCQVYARSWFESYRQNADTALLTQAERYFALAAETLYREVEEISVNSSREIFFDRDFPVLEQWLDTRMRLFEATANSEHAEKAFQIAAQSKAFLLAGAMQRSGALRYAGVPDSILQAELRLREQIVSAEKTLDAPGPQQNTRMDSASLALNRELSRWREEYDDLLRQIERRYPEYFHLRLLRHDGSTTELCRHLLAPDQALLMYSQTPTNLYAFVLTRDTFCIKALPTDNTLSQDLEHFRKCLTEYFTDSNPGDALYDQTLEQYLALAPLLYRQLILPVASLLPERVVIIPEGKLCYIPFEALLTDVPPDAGNFRAYPFWAREKAVSYALSTDFLRETTGPIVRHSEKGWLGLAPFAETTGEAGPANSIAARIDSRRPLPFSGKEVRDIAALLQGEAWLGASARPGRFRAEASRYRILHLATHSRADDRLGDYSYLDVSSTGEPLPAKDLYQFSLAADMVVLSACEAGSGKLLRGEGIIGLVRAFAYAGAHSVVASLWVANDQSTAGLMVDFYRNLRKGMPKDMALKAARINLLNRAPAEAHPFFWAGFRVYGNVSSLWSH